MNILPEIPSPEDLASDVMAHRPDDLMFNPPCAQNEWGHVQCANSITAFTAQQFAPYLANSMTDKPWLPTFLPTAELFLDGKLAASWPRPHGVIRHQWFPHQVVREAEIDGLELRSELFLPPRRRTAALRLRLRNSSDRHRAGTLGFSLVANVARANFNINGRPGFLGSASGGYDDDPDSLPLAEPLCEHDNEAIESPDYCGILFRARHSDAWCLQGVSRPVVEFPQSRMAVVRYELSPRGEDEIHFVSAIAATREAAIADFRAVMADFDASQRETRATWVQRLQNVFTPGNPEFSGSLPRLRTTDRALWKLYHNAIITGLFCRSCAPDSKLGPTYLAVRGQQRPARVYIWDTALASLPLALLDPAALKRFLEQWFRQHPERHMDIDFITGRSLENHYATNQMMLVYACENYLRVTREYAWLDTVVAGRTILEHLERAAVFWKTRVDPLGLGLGDYTESDLLEVVSSYHGVVAGLQAGSVYAMRYVAALRERRGELERAGELRAEADALARRTIEHLYVRERGYWQAATRDGAKRDVRTVHDFVTTLQFMGDDLGETRRGEMLQFFWRELAADAWLHALSPFDPDAATNKRADHAWCGSYPGWPSLCARAALRYDRGARTTGWIRSLARSANQGPFGQAHLVPGPFPDENGGAAKAPLIMPLLAEWMALSGMEFAGMIIEDVFGVTFGAAGPEVNQSRISDFDPLASLEQLRCGATHHRVSASGIVPTL